MIVGVSVEMRESVGVKDGVGEGVFVAVSVPPIFVGDLVAVKVRVFVLVPMGDEVGDSVGVEALVGKVSS